MKIYSHSKISTFETCPYQYKLKYIDKVKVDIPTTIEAFMGNLVHQTLEKLHRDKMNNQIISMDSISEFYLRLWEEKYTDKILIAKFNEGLTEESYKLMGLKFILDYYNRKKPFEEKEIIDLETKDLLKLKNGILWYVMIDKLERDSQGNYYICDYKTNSRMKTKEEIASDRQLAMYSIWVKEKFKDARNILLKWDMLAFNKEITSFRTEEQLRRLEEEICKKIVEIESTYDFPMNPSPLCGYCIFNQICPAVNENSPINIPTRIISG